MSSGENFEFPSDSSFDYGAREDPAVRAQKDGHINVIVEAARTLMTMPSAIYPTTTDGFGINSGIEHVINYEAYTQEPVEGAAQSGISMTSYQAYDETGRFKQGVSLRLADHDKGTRYEIPLERVLPGRITSEANLYPDSPRTSPDGLRDQVDIPTLRHSQLSRLQGAAATAQAFINHAQTNNLTVPRL